MQQGAFAYLAQYPQLLTVFGLVLSSLPFRPCCTRWTSASPVCDVTSDPVAADCLTGRLTKFCAVRCMQCPSTGVNCDELAAASELGSGGDGRRVAVKNAAEYWVRPFGFTLLYPEHFGCPFVHRPVRAVDSAVNDVVVGCSFALSGVTSLCGFIFALHLEYS